MKLIFLFKTLKIYCRFQKCKQKKKKKKRSKRFLVFQIITFELVTLNSLSLREYSQLAANVQARRGHMFSKSFPRILYLHIIAHHTILSFYPHGIDGITSNINISQSTPSSRTLQIWWKGQQQNFQHEHPLPFVDICHKDQILIFVDIIFVYHTLLCSYMT